MKIAVIGAGYVGLSNALLLSQSNKVIIYDKDQKKVDLIKNKISPIKDKLASSFLSKYHKNISSKQAIGNEINDCSICIIAVSTDFSKDLNAFDTNNITNILQSLNSYHFKKQIVIRSTVPIGFTEQCQKNFKQMQISFFPEFVREGKALYDSLFPSRVVAGGNIKSAQPFINLLLKNSKKRNIKVINTSSSEAEAIKLFSNSFLALRVSFFNELDTFSLLNNLDPRVIIQGLGTDKRIGNHYNNPSFGYGGYCLPKDTKQLVGHYHNTPNRIISSIEKSNQTRKLFIAKEIIKTNKDIIGIYKLEMKKDSDNFRESAIIEIINYLKKSKKEVIIYEPSIKDNKFLGCHIINNFEEFINSCELIVVNRKTKALSKIDKPVFSRDIFNLD